MNWLAYRPEKPKLSFFVLSFVCLSDALVYLGVLLFLAKTSPVNLIALILGYAFVKACRYTVWSHRLLLLLPVCCYCDLVYHGVFIIWLGNWLVLVNNDLSFD